MIYLSACENNAFKLKFLLILFTEDYILSGEKKNPTKRSQTKNTIITWELIHINWFKFAKKSFKLHNFFSCFTIHNLLNTVEFNWIGKKRNWTDFWQYSHSLDNFLLYTCNYHAFLALILPFIFATKWHLKLSLTWFSQLYIFMLWICMTTHIYGHIY